MTKSSETDIFGELSEKYFNIFTAPLLSNNWSLTDAERLHQGGQRQRRGTYIGLEVQIRGPATPVPREWGKYIANPKNKEWLELYSSACFLSTIDF